MEQPTEQKIAVVSPLTDEQADQVADKIAQTTRNVYLVAEGVLGRKLDLEENDAVYEHVERIGKIFKCAGCDVWTPDSETGDLEDHCVECAGEEDEGDDE